MSTVSDEENAPQGPSPLAVPMASVGTGGPEPQTGIQQENFPFEAMNLRVGDRLQVQPPSRVSLERSPVKLIGFLQDVSLLITAPLTPGGVPLPLMSNDQLIVRVFSGQNAFGFACDVQRVCKLPYGYLHVSFPQKVQGTVIRKAARVRTKIIVNVRANSVEGVDQAGVLSNLSADGALLDGRRAMAEVGDVLCLNFRLRLHNIEAELTLNALVRTIFFDDNLKQTGSTLAHFGVQFVDLAANDQMLLQSMVYQHMIEQPQSLI